MLPALVSRVTDGEGKSHLPMRGSSHPALARGSLHVAAQLHVLKEDAILGGKKLGRDVLNTHSSLGRKRSCTLHSLM